VQSLSIATPQGDIATHAVPASATGPSLKELLVGSEGIYGIITSATMKVLLCPQKNRMLTVFFRNFSDGREAVRHLIREGIRPSIVRVHDPEETHLFMGLAPTSGLKRLLAPVWLAWKGLGSRPCFAMFSSEGGNELVRFEVERIRAAVLRAGGSIVSEDDGSRWRGGRFELPYLRDDLLDHGYFIDTLETAAPWSKLDAIHAAVREAFGRRGGSGLIVGAHLSHAYPDGASLYFTFIGRQDPGHEIAQWEKIKSLATETILAEGGTLSHHHGIGYDHRRWMEREQTPLGLEVLKSVKKTLDPEGILNPGKVI
jgi:alkyldihydroxyacetonephosphate synthase